jgi:cytochrome P450
MTYFSNWIGLANPPGSREEERATRAGRPDRYKPLAQHVFGFLRWTWPIARVGRYAVVARHDDVEEVLTRSDVFEVPFADEIARLNDGDGPGTPFILGIDDRQVHDAQAGAVMRAFRREDIAVRVAQFSAQRAREIVEAGDGKLEAIGQLIRRIPLEICTDYYGIEIANPKAFTEAAIGVSGHLFGIPPIVETAAANRQADVLRADIDRAIASERARPSAKDTIVARLCRSELDDKQIRAFIMGMIMGFVPTNTMAGGKILEVLLRRPKFLEAARAAATCGDDDLLAHCLFEALRFMPINFGPFRRCKRDFVLAEGTPRATPLREGTFVLASTMSAMFDPASVENPTRFVPGRPASHLMHFGFGMHWCVGAFIARAQITQTFKPLVAMRELRRAPGRAGKLRLTFPVIGFPRSLGVRYLR